MSASIRPTRRPRMCNASARLVATVDLPTPPLPLATATKCLTPGNVMRWKPGPGGCMITHLNVTYLFDRILATDETRTEHGNLLLIFFFRVPSVLHPWLRQAGHWHSSRRYS